MNGGPQKRTIPKLWFVNMRAVLEITEKIAPYYAVKNTILDPIDSHVYFPDNDIPVYNAYLLIVNSCQ